MYKAGARPREATESAQQRTASRTAYSSSARETRESRGRDTDAALFLDAGAGFPDASRDRGRAEGVWVWKSAEVLPRRSAKVLPARYTVPRHVNAVLPAH